MIPIVLLPPGQHPKSRFTVLTYNILAELYATQQAFPTTEQCALLWQYRRQLIMRELALYDADIVCLQEVQSTSFHEDLRPEMDRRGFDAVFKKKTQVCAWGLSATPWHMLHVPLGMKCVPIVKNSKHVAVCALQARSGLVAAS
jgi:mRNA deadenylase 3'-5' endonuclease subunit Ccr4